MGDFFVRHMDGKITTNREYEFTEQKMLGHVLRSGDRLLEIGANIGTSSIYAAKLVPDLEYHISVEPSTKVLPYLRRNLRENNVEDRIEVIDGAIFGTCSTSDLFLSKPQDPEHNDWSAHLVAAEKASEGSGSTHGFRPVKCVTLHEALKGRELPNVMFMDCEGCFPDLVASYPNLLRDARDIVMEVDGGGMDVGETVEMLGENGFSCSRVLSETHPEIPYLICSKAPDGFTNR